MMGKSFSWIGLMIGNSRLHWAKFQGGSLEHTWDTDHSQRDFSFLGNLPLYVASVVPTQTQLWQNYPKTRVITLENIPLKSLYPTLGIDRALAVLGAGKIYGFPCLVIDAGTALTFSAGDSNCSFYGGAILPGLGLQLQILGTKTAALPNVSLPNSLPPRWAIKTPEAITSGVIYSVLASVKDFIEDWWSKFNSAVVVITGGDGQLLIKYLQEQVPEIAQMVKYEPYLIFWGMQETVTINQEL